MTPKELDKLQTIAIVDLVSKALGRSVVINSRFMTEQEFELLAHKFLSETSAIKKTPWDRGLGWFKWFCGHENQIHIELIRKDLAKDALAMIMEGRSRRYIATALLWRVVFGTIIPIIWDWVVRFIGRKSFRSGGS